MAQRGKAESIAALAVYADDDEMEDEDEMEEQNLESIERVFPSDQEASASINITKVNGGEDRTGDTGVLGILNYGQEEAAGTPGREEDEEGSRMALGVREATQTDQGEGDRRERPRTPPGTVFVLTPKKAAGTPTKGTPVPEDGAAAAERPAPNERTGVATGDERDGQEGTNGGAPSANGTETAVPRETDSEAREREGFDDFLPPPPTTKCGFDLQAKFARYLDLKRRDGRHINDALRISKGYRNPDFMQQAVEHQGIDEIGSCFPKDVFDPHRFNPTDYYDQLALELRKQNERKEQERKQKGQIEFQRGSVQLPPGPPKPVVQLITGQKGIFPAPSLGLAGIPGIPPMMPPAVPSASAAADSAPKAEGRDRKRSKWDKVEGEGGRLPAGRTAQEALAAAKAHAAAINAGGASAPLHSKRRDTEGDGKARSRDKGSR